MAINPVKSIQHLAIVLLIFQKKQQIAPASAKNANQ
jgi:hypothetical protein